MGYSRLSFSSAETKRLFIAWDRSDPLLVLKALTSVSCQWIRAKWADYNCQPVKYAHKFCALHPVLKTSKTTVTCSGTDNSVKHCRKHSFVKNQFSYLFYNYLSLKLTNLKCKNVSIDAFWAVPQICQNKESEKLLHHFFVCRHVSFIRSVK